MPYQLQQLYITWLQEDAVHVVADLLHTQQSLGLALYIAFHQSGYSAPCTLAVAASMPYHAMMMEDSVNSNEQLAIETTIQFICIE